MSEDDSMVIISSDKLNVYMFRDVDYQGDVFYTVRYGFDQKTFSGFTDAVNFYSDCCEHSLQCNDL